MLIYFGPILSSKTYQKIGTHLFNFKDGSMRVEFPKAFIYNTLKDFCMFKRKELKPILLTCCVCSQYNAY